MLNPKLASWKAIVKPQTTLKIHCHLNMIDFNLKTNVAKLFHCSSLNIIISDWIYVKNSIVFKMNLAHAYVTYYSELTITMSLIRPWCPENFLTIFLVSISKTLILKSSKAIPRIPLPRISSTYDHEYSEIKKRKTSITLLQKYRYPEIISEKPIYTLLQTSTTSWTTSSLLHFKHQKLKLH